MSANVRLRLKFEEKDVNANEAQLFLVNSGNVKTIADLSEAIKNRFYKGLTTKVVLLIDEFVLPVDELIDIIRDNDVILVKCSSSTPSSTPKKTMKNKDKITPKSSTKNQRPKAENAKAESDCDLSDFETNNSKKKRFDYYRGSEFSQPLSSTAPLVHLKKIPNLIKYKTLNVGLSNCDEILDEVYVANLIQNKKSDGSNSTQLNNKKASVKSLKAAFDKSFFSEYTREEHSNESTEVKEPMQPREDVVDFDEQMKYENCPTLTSIPKLGDTIAFKIMKVSTKSYLPVISEFKAGKIINVDFDTQMLVIELLKDEVVKEFCRDRVFTRTRKLFVDWNTLVDPKLVIQSHMESSETIKSNEMNVSSIKIENKSNEAQMDELNEAPAINDANESLKSETPMEVVNDFEERSVNDGIKSEAELEFRCPLMDYT